MPRFSNDYETELNTMIWAVIRAAPFLSKYWSLSIFSLPHASNKEHIWFNSMLWILQPMTKTRLILIIWELAPVNLDCWVLIIIFIFLAFWSMANTDVPLPAYMNLLAWPVVSNESITLAGNLISLFDLLL